MQIKWMICASKVLCQNVFRKSTCLSTIRRIAPSLNALSLKMLIMIAPVSTIAIIALCTMLSMRARANVILLHVVRLLEMLMKR